MDGFALVQLIESELKRRNITKGTFYRESGISSATMSQWRNGVYAPSKSAIEAVEKFFGITLTLTQKEKPAIQSDDGPAKHALLAAIDDMSEEELSLLLDRAKKIKDSRV